MSAAHSVMALVRAHYRRDEIAFANAAGLLARGAKTPTIRNEIVDLIRRGYQARMGSDPRSGASPSRSGLLPTPTQGVLQPLPTVGFQELLLEPPLQALLDEFVIELEYREELATRNLRARNRFLFYGPPGNGKTISSAALANALGVEGYVVSISELVSMYLGGTASNLATLFRGLREDMVVVFDEIDAIGSTRGAIESSAGKEMNATVTAMLTLMDRHRTGVIVATTNRPDMLDQALLRRFDEHVEFPEPSLAQKQSLAAKLSERFGIGEVDVARCANLDQVTKTVEREARRIVMRELLAAEAEGSDAADNDAPTLN